MDESRQNLLRTGSSRLLSELRRYASWVLKGENEANSFQTSDLVQETFLRLSSLNSIQWNDEKHLIRMAGLLMRRIMVDHARKKKSLKRSGQLRVVLADEGQVPDSKADDAGLVLTLDDAMERLGEIDEMAAMVAQQRVFGGFDLDEIAEMLEVSVSTVKRKWNIAKTWLYRELKDEA